MRGFEYVRVLNLKSVFRLVGEENIRGGEITILNPYLIFIHITSEVMASTRTPRNREVIVKSSKLTNLLLVSKLQYLPVSLNIAGINFRNISASTTRLA